MTLPINRRIIAFVQAQILLETGLDAPRVHDVTGIDVAVEDLPDIATFLIDDKPQVEGGANSGGCQTRILNFGVTISVASDSDADTDDLAVKVRKATLQDPTMALLIADLDWSQEWGTGSGATPVAMTKLLFTATYRWRPEW